jgi:gas vesicle protein
MKNDGSYGFWSGLLLGATFGAAATFLLTPKSGRQVRSDLRAGRDRLKGELTDRANELLGRGEAALARAKEAARETADGMKRGAARLLKGDEGTAEDGHLSSSSMG